MQINLVCIRLAGDSQWKALLLRMCGSPALSFYCFVVCFGPRGGMCAVHGDCSLGKEVCMNQGLKIMIFQDLRAVEAVLAFATFWTPCSQRSMLPFVPSTLSMSLANQARIQHSDDSEWPPPLAQRSWGESGIFSLEHMQTKTPFSPIKPVFIGAPWCTHSQLDCMNNK